jgi:predicted nucleotidyltransferase
MMATADRTRDVAHFMIDLRAWAVDHPAIRAVAIAGSWAHGDARMDSDVDIVVLVDRPERFFENLSWAGELGELAFLQTRNWGVVTEVRFALSDGLELEFGFTPLSWASIDPVDEGTRRVVQHGIAILHDPDGLLKRLTATCRELQAQS